MPANGSKNYLTGNVLAFVYFAGLAGGFFSVTTGLRSRSLEPGEDVYFVWYVLTKPLVGAFGAVALFLLLGGGLVQLELIDELTAPQPSAKVFGFAFLAGFSERIAFPNLR